jgi:hypothetical protein
MREKANSIAAKYLDKLSKKQENKQWGSVVKTLTKSADTQLRSNYLVSTDGETGGQGEELMVFPTTQKYASLRCALSLFRQSGVKP